LAGLTGNWFMGTIGGPIGGVFETNPGSAGRANRDGLTNGILEAAHSFLLFTVVTQHSPYIIGDGC
jgi:hypothetical protein